jgi:hypothetical protein
MQAAIDLRDTGAAQHPSPQEPRHQNDPGPSHCPSSGRLNASYQLLGGSNHQINQINQINEINQIHQMTR